MTPDRLELSESYIQNIKDRINVFLQHAIPDVLLFVHDVLEEGDDCSPNEVHRLSHIHKQNISFTIKFQANE